MIAPNINEIEIRGGMTKAGQKEMIQELSIRTGEVVALVGPTGSGKSMLLSDIEQMAAADTPTGRIVTIKRREGGDMKQRMIAQLSQTMNFVIDMEVAEFLSLHASSQRITDGTIVDKVIALANSLAGEPITPNTEMTTLSGGQSRALMVADIAIISDSPIVLIDEIENAGIDRLKALEILSAQGKIVIIASHDPMIILRSDKRIAMRDGGMTQISITQDGERRLLEQLIIWDKQVVALREALRNGGTISICLEGALSCV